jgi:hypothetical protein
MDEKLKALAKGKSGKNLIEVLVGVQALVADIRTPLDITENQNEIRLGVIKILEEQIINKLRVYNSENNPSNPNEFV